jgi:VWFA-related protein
MNKKKLFFLILLLTLLLQLRIQILSFGAIQEKKDQVELRHEVTVVLKLVQVCVEDKDGNPVTDLTKDDFILYDNGQLQAITDFEKHFFSGPEKEIAEEVVETKLTPAPQIPSKMNRKFFLLLDTARINVQGMSKSKKTALHFIETQLQPDDTVGILSYHPFRGLILHEYLTTDHRKIMEAVKKIRGVSDEVSDELLMQRITSKQSGTTSGVTFTKSYRPEDEYNKMKARQFATEIKELAKSLGSIPGYKNIILFSAGLARSLLYDYDDPGVRGKIEDTAKELAASNVPVYSVNTEGNRAYFKEGGERGDHSLKMLSNLSGGKYFDNVDYYETIAKDIQNVTGNYYVLGYYIDEEWDGKYQKIKVEVRRKGCQVHAQEGYFNPKPFTEYSDFEKQLHLYDLAMSENPQFQSPLNFPSIALPYSEKEESNLLVLTEVPIDKIKEIAKGETEVFTYIFDEENNIVDSYEGKVNFYALPQKKVCLYSISSLAPGNYECRHIIRDIKTGKGAVAPSSVVIPAESDEGIHIFPPLLFVPDKETTFLRLSEPSKKRYQEDYQSINDIFPFLSSEFSPLINEIEHGILILLAVLRLSIDDIPEHEIELALNLNDLSNNEIIPLDNSSLVSTENVRGTEVLLIKIQLPELETGSYSIEIIVDELTTQTRSKVNRNFDIK